MGELDRVLGGGLVDGAVILLGGDPGIGKSTLLLQTIAKMAQSRKVLYVSGEESAQQVALRAQRLELPTEGVNLLAEIRMEAIQAALKQHQARSRGYRLHPNHVFRPNHFRPRLRVAGTRVRRPADAHGETDGHRHDTGRTRYQRRSDCRSARSGTHGRYRTVFRGRPAFQLPYDTRHQKPFRRSKRIGRIRHDRKRFERRIQPVRYLPCKLP